ncbi:RidA family protein [Sneathiella sp. P13V-1]|uniref:RidA family protein n=1 Tax=Sneathiella sp. P13V-1 TaxID=2697366 RepID=UPI00187B3996|nr:RidA family protein [Sneathiella sp. P13V-1]MBE7637208.1 RidA family protein [Sneathiella sp. P13V-1]
MTEITRLDKGPRMSQAVVYNGTIHLAGQVGTPGESVTDQTKQILSQIDSLLERCGSDKSKLLMATIWLADMADFAEMNAVWDAWVDPENPPARACGEAKLAAPGFTVEIMITAAE